MKNKLRQVSVVNVRIWGHRVGAVAWNKDRGIGVFKYDPDFLKLGLNVAPLIMPLGENSFSFPETRNKTYLGLPGMLADTLPNKYGNKLIEIWLQERGRTIETFTPIERLCYMGHRAMGALEFQPAYEPRVGDSKPIEISELIGLSNEILQHRRKLNANFLKNKHEALRSIIQIGTSAGGNRPKAVIAWNPKTGEIRSGQVKVPEGFEPWILKFDGVSDQILGNTKGYGRLEYAYYLMATAAGIRMSPCRLLDENERTHFMTKRFDRDENGGKIHLQSLCAIAHYDFNEAGVHSYEEVLDVIMRLKLGHEDLQEIYKRMIFNVLARNQDDHTRNISFLMNQEGQWGLSPAYDLILAYNPSGLWTNTHQMSIHGTRDGFTISDLESPAKMYSIFNAKKLVEQVEAAIAGWPKFAKMAGIDSKKAKIIQKVHRRINKKTGKVE